MFERFTETARRVVVHAQAEARALDHGHIGTEHLLLGLLHADTGGAARALGAAGVDLDTARHEVEAIVGRGAPERGDEIPFTPRAKKVLELSLREALQLGNDDISAEHILLGLVREGDGIGVQALKRRGVDTDELRRNVTLELRGRAPGRPRGPSGAPHPAPSIEERLTAIEHRLERIERILRDGPGPCTP